MSEERDIFAFLKSLIEGEDVGYSWHQWLASNDRDLKRLLSPGSLLRLKFHPLSEAELVLKQHGITYRRSDKFEWLDVDSTAGKCRYCGETIQHDNAGGAWCPKGCFTLMV